MPNKEQLWIRQLGMLVSAGRCPVRPSDDGSRCEISLNFASRPPQSLTF